MKMQVKYQCKAGMVLNTVTVTCPQQDVPYSINLIAMPWLRDIGQC